jgi:hypothetical protein
MIRSFLRALEQMEGELPLLNNFFKVYMFQVIGTS